MGTCARICRLGAILGRGAGTSTIGVRVRVAGGLVTLDHEISHAHGMHVSNVSAFSPHMICGVCILFAFYFSLFACFFSENDSDISTIYA